MTYNEMVKEIKMILSQDDVVVAGYLSGSYANGYFIPGVSDLDILIIVKNRKDIQRVVECLECLNFDIDLDITCIAQGDLADKEKQIIREVVLSSKVSGKLFYGLDVLRSWELPPLADYLKGTINQTVVMIERARNNSYSKKLEYPCINDPYKGYVCYGDNNYNLKLLTSIYTWIATCYLAEKGVYCGCKNDCIKMSKKYLPADFSNQIEQVFYWCREIWHYKLPTSSSDKEKLKEFCNRALYVEIEFINRMVKE